MENIRSCLGKFLDVSEDTLGQHPFNPTPRFHLLLMLECSLFLILGMCSSAFVMMAFATVFLVSAFIYCRLCTGLKINQILLYVHVAFASGSALFFSAQSHYNAVDAAKGVTTNSTILCVMSVVFTIPFLIFSDIILLKMYKLSRTSNVSSAPPSIIVSDVPPQQAAPVATQSYPVDIAQSDGAAVLHA